MENTSGDFWRMIVERDCRVIVMLNPLKEGDEASSMEQEVCYQYWPDSDAKKHGEYSVELVSDTENDGYAERIISVKDKVNREIHTYSANSFNSGAFLSLACHIR